MKMLASDGSGVERESAPGFGPVTFLNRLIINELLAEWRPEMALVRLPEDGQFAGRFSALEA
jgi:hypothetical protein